MTWRSKAGRAKAGVRRSFTGVAQRWRRSLGFRVVASTVVLGLATIAALGTFVTTTIRDGLFDERLEQVLSEAANSTRTLQATLDSSTASTGTEVLTLITSNLSALEGSGSSRRGVALLRPASTTSPVSIPDWYSSSRLSGTISPALQESVTSDGGQRWQSVTFSLGGAEVPGVAVGAMLTLPVVGEYQFYLVLSLEPEASTLSFVQGVLLGGSAILVALVALIAWVVTRQVVRPVTDVSRAAERLSRGHLDERLTVRGEDEVAALTRSFNDMAASLEEKIDRMAEMSATQRRFVSDVAHELRTPLTTIRMAAEVIFQSRENLSPSVRRSAELMSNQLDRFEALLAELLEISRFDAGAAVLEAEDVNVVDVVRRVIDLAEPLAVTKAVALRVHGADAPVSADIDPRRIERIVRNLVVNAVEHADGKPVDITLGASSSAVAIVVRDHGVGMTIEQTAHVFDRFWRADPARARTTGGTGLGLAISLEDAHLHGGWLEAWGRPGQGASFRLTLPRRGGMRLAESPLELVDLEQGVEATSSSSPSAVPDLGGASWADDV